MLCNVSRDLPICTGCEGLLKSFARFGMARNVSSKREKSGRFEDSFDQHFNKIVLKIIENNNLTLNYLFKF